MSLFLNGEAGQFKVGLRVGFETGQGLLGLTL